MVIFEIDGLYSYRKLLQKDIDPVDLAKHFAIWFAVLKEDRQDFRRVELVRVEWQFSSQPFQKVRHEAFLSGVHGVLRPKLDDMLNYS